MTDRTAPFTKTRPHEWMDTVRLRHIAAQTKNFMEVLDDLHGYLATVTSTEDRHVTTVVEQAAAAAHDLAITATIAADTIPG